MTTLGGAPVSSAWFIDLELPCWVLAPGDPLIVSGYPDQFRGVNYAARTIQVLRKELEAEYLGPGISAACHELRFLDVEGFTTLSGFSGSPVFSVRHSGDRRAHAALAGMMLRGNCRMWP
jgi:hypothetical protein